MAFETIVVETDDHIAQVRLNRPDAMNAINDQMLSELAEALTAAQKDPKVRCIVISGTEKFFAAGVDVRQMAEKSFTDVFAGEMFGDDVDAIARIRKPIIAAVSGYALGGGCELAMMCDFIIAGESAKFGQPEITLGVMPGMGGTQRLARAVGKAKTMEMCLTGRHMDAKEAESSGLVARVVADHDVVEEAMRAADKVAGFSMPAVLMTKETVNRAFESTLAEGLRFERRVFHSMFALEDQKEGMAAFAEKRSPSFKNR